MKQLLHKIACAALTLCSACIFASCGSEGSGPASGATGDEPDTTAVTTTDKATSDEASAAAADPSTIKKETDLTKLHALSTPGDLFTGYWKITEGTGEKLENFVFCFDGDDHSYLLLDNVGYFAVYEVHTQDGKDVFSTQMLFGLNGDYTYEFSKDKNAVVLTRVSDGATSTLEKMDSFSSIPKAPSHTKIDEALLGAWKDDTGNYLYFDKDGIMYDCQQNFSFTFYTYSASDGVISTVSEMVETTEDSVKYQVNGDQLMYNDYQYIRVSADELP